MWAKSSQYPPTQGYLFIRPLIYLSVNLAANLAALIASINTSLPNFIFTLGAASGITSFLFMQHLVDLPHCYVCRRRIWPWQRLINPLGEWHYSCWWEHKQGRGPLHEEATS